MQKSSQLQTQGLLAEIKIYQDSIFLKKYPDTDRDNSYSVTGFSEYEISASDLAAAVKDAPFSSGFLPTGTFFYGIKKGQPLVGLRMDASIRKIIVEVGDDEHLNLTVPLPPMVFLGYGREYWVCALKPAQVFGPHSPIMLAPVPNVDSDNGEICTGTATFPEAKPETMARAAEVFFESMFDTANSENKVKGYANVITFLQKLDGKKEFPSSALMPDKKNRSVKMFVNAIFNGGADV